MIKGTRFRTDHQVGQMPTVGNYNALNQAAQLVANTFGGASNWMNGAGLGSQDSAVHTQLQAIVTTAFKSNEINDSEDSATHEAKAIFRLSSDGGWDSEDDADWVLRIDATSKPEVDLDVGRVYDFYFDQSIGLWQPLISPLLTYPFELIEDFIRGSATLAKRLIRNDDDGWAQNENDTYMKTGEEISVFDHFVGPNTGPFDDFKEASIDPWNDPPLESGTRGLYQYAAADHRVIVFIHRPRHNADFILYKLSADMPSTADTGFLDGILESYGGKVPPITSVKNVLGFAGTAFTNGYAVRTPGTGADGADEYVIMQHVCPVVCP